MVSPFTDFFFFFIVLNYQYIEVLIIYYTYQLTSKKLLKLGDNNTS